MSIMGRRNEFRTNVANLAIRPGFKTMMIHDWLMVDIKVNAQLTEIDYEVYPVIRKGRHYYAPVVPMTTGKVTADQSMKWMGRRALLEEKLRKTIHSVTCNATEFKQQWQIKHDVLATYEPNKYGVGMLGYGDDSCYYTSVIDGDLNAREVTRYIKNQCDFSWCRQLF